VLSNARACVRASFTRDAQSLHRSKLRRCRFALGDMRVMIDACCRVSAAPRDASRCTDDNAVRRG